jgi:hypothetical protein
LSAPAKTNKTSQSVKPPIKNITLEIATPTAREKIRIDDRQSADRKLGAGLQAPIVTNNGLTKEGIRNVQKIRNFSVYLTRRSHSQTLYCRKEEIGNLQDNGTKEGNGDLHRAKGWNENLLQSPTLKRLFPSF